MNRRIKAIFKRIPIVSDIARAVYNKFPRQQVSFETSGQYWDDRYAQAGDSGDGSYGRLAQFKAEIINAFVAENVVETVVEFGCGDGAQLRRMNYRQYIGVDVSPKVLDICKQDFKDDPSKTFYHIDDNEVGSISTDLALSLDVIYHLIENDVFEAYMHRLFESSEKWVIIYSSNFDSPTPLDHVRHRAFSDWILTHKSDWKLEAKIDQRFPYKPNREEDTSFADFYIYRFNH